MWHPSNTFCTQAVQSHKHNHFDRWLEKQPNKSSSNIMAFCMSLWKTRMLCCLLFTHYQQQYIFRRPLLVPPDRQDKFHEAEFHFKYNSLGHVLCFSFFLVVVSLTKREFIISLGGCCEEYDKYLQYCSVISVCYIHTGKVKLTFV